MKLQSRNYRKRNLALLHQEAYIYCKRILNISMISSRIPSKQGYFNPAQIEKLKNTYQQKDFSINAF
ncbi:hypothetical protein CS542_07230 [Pedobacter sp. IW39]|nr:hypothetical protein CS542_07230 [Pedobacter sp. IW39]